MSNSSLSVKASSITPSHLLPRTIASIGTALAIIAVVGGILALLASHGTPLGSLSALKIVPQAVGMWLAGGGIVLLGLGVTWLVCHRPSPTQSAAASASESSCSIEEESAAHGVLPPLTITNSAGQTAAYSALQEVYGDATHDRDCDQFGNCGFPSDEARLTITDEKEKLPTNGALIWDNLIMIQGPHTTGHIADMQAIVTEHEVGAVVRLGPIAYQDYTLDDVRMHAIEEWPDHDVAPVAEIYDLIVTLDGMEGKIMAHCRAGVGRTGVFAACWRIHQLRQAGATEVDPAAIVQELRGARAGMVQKSEQFQMILDFIEHLNQQ